MSHFPENVLPRHEQPRNVRLGPEARLGPGVEAGHVVLEAVELSVELAQVVVVGHGRRHLHVVDVVADLWEAG